MPHNNHKLGLMLRFRDFVLEDGGTIAEHQRLIQRKYAWWGWWSRQKELIPRDVMKYLNPTPDSPIQIILFDRGAGLLFSTYCDKIILSPSYPPGINAPEVEFAPEYYIRGRYPAWFRLCKDIKQTAVTSVKIVARPTITPVADVNDLAAEGVSTDLEPLENEPATLWVIERTE